MFFDNYKLFHIFVDKINIVTNGEFVSRVINGLRLLNKDEHVSRRYILGIGQNKSKFYISQKLLDKSLSRETNLFKTIQCLPLSRIDSVKCGVHEFMKCDDLMVSNNKIPALVFNRLGSSIMSVTSVNGDYEFSEISLKSYSLSKDRPGSSLLNKKYYYVQDNKLYLPDTTITAVTVTFIPYDEVDVELACSCSEHDCCKSVWDYQFMVPDKLSEQIITETIQEVSNVRKVVADNLPNLDDNQKTLGGG